jgi:hypothetical protein
MRLSCPDRSRRNSPFAASRTNSASGIVDHRKYDSRDASEYSSTAAIASVPATGASTRNRNRGEANTAIIARPTPSSKVFPGWAYVLRATSTSRATCAASTGRRYARSAKLPNNSRA